jgi:hypothetical protein
VIGAVDFANVFVGVAAGAGWRRFVLFLNAGVFGAQIFIYCHLAFLALPQTETGS